LRKPISSDGDQIIAKARIAPTPMFLRRLQATAMMESPVRKGISATINRPASSRPKIGASGTISSSAPRLPVHSQLCRK